MGAVYRARQRELNRWEATPAEIRKELTGTRRQAEVRLVASDVPQLYLFRTSEGGQGILQILACSEAPERAKIRYKLLPP